MFTDDSSLYENAVAHDGDGVSVVVGEVEVAGEPELDAWVGGHDVHEGMWVDRVIQPRAPSNKDVMLAENIVFAFAKKTIFRVRTSRSAAILIRIVAIFAQEVSHVDR